MIAHGKRIVASWQAYDLSNGILLTAAIVFHENRIAGDHKGKQRIAKKKD